MSLYEMKNVNKEQLLELIDNKVFENKELEYKSYSFTGGKMDKDRDKFMKEIAAFANTNGGTIIIGMQEDDNRLPTKLNGAGLSLKEFDNWLSSFRQVVLSRIRPHLHGVECVPVELDDDNIAIVISVPKSYARPHSFWDGNKDEFFMRYANGITYMDIDDLRKAFLYSSSVQDKIRQFRRDRISMILASECIGDLGNDAKLVFHILPEWSFGLGNTVDLNKLNHNTAFRPITGSGWNYRFNADGYCIYGQNFDSKEINTYTQAFHNGILEGVEIKSFSKYQEKEVYVWSQTQATIKRAISEYGDILKCLGVPKPWHISATILNAKGYVTTRGWGEFSEPIERDIVNSLEGVCTDDISMEDALGPIFDSLSNAFGFYN